MSFLFLGKNPYKFVVVDPHLHASLEVSFHTLMDVTWYPVPVSSPVFKCPDCFIWSCSYIVYPSNMKGPFRDNCLRYFYIYDWRS